MTACRLLFLDHSAQVCEVSGSVDALVAYENGHLYCQNGMNIVIDSAYYGRLSGGETTPCGGQASGRCTDT